MWIPWLIPLPSLNDDERSPDEDRKPERTGAKGELASDARSEEDRSTFARLLRSGPEPRDTSGKAKTEVADPRAPKAKSGPEPDETDTPREDRNEPDWDRPSSRIGPTAPDGQPNFGGAAALGYSPGSSSHDPGGHDHRGGGSGEKPTPGMVILGALQGTAEPPSMPTTASEDEGRIGALLREVVDAVWATNPTTHAQAAVRLEITEETLPKTTIDLAMKDGELLVTITTGSPDVERFLADHLGKLRDRLALRLRGRTVRVELARADSSEAAGEASPDRDEPVRSAGDQGE